MNWTFMGDYGDKSINTVVVYWCDSLTSTSRKLHSQNGSWKIRSFQVTVNPSYVQTTVLMMFKVGNCNTAWWLW